MADTYYDDVVLLLHFDGTNGATSFTDSSPLAWTVTGYSGVALSTTDPLFGSACLSVPDGTGGAWIDPVSGGADFRFGTGDFTVEGQVKTTANDIALIYFYPTGGESWIWYPLLSASGYLEWWRFPASGSAVKIAGATTAPLNTGAWTSWAVSRVSGTLRLFVDGVEVASASDSTNYTADTESCVIARNKAAKHDEIRITKGVGRYAAGYTTQTAAFPDEGPSTDVTGYVSADTMLGDPQVLGIAIYGAASAETMLGDPQLLGTAVYGLASAETMLGAAEVLGLHDFTEVLDADAITYYVMDLETPGGLVRVPISSWQATLQAGEVCYVQCVVPACADWVTDLGDATEFVISRTAEYDGLTIEYEMARAPLETLSLAQGPTNYSATISGYSDALTADDNPPVAFDRDLANIRTIFTTNGDTRARASIDWLLRPGHRAYAGATEIIVDFISYYVGQGDAYMDVGERS